MDGFDDIPVISSLSADGFEDVPISLILNASGKEDVPVSLELLGTYWGDLPIIASLSADAKEDISTLFKMFGSFWGDVPLSFKLLGTYWGDLKTRFEMKAQSFCDILVSHRMEGVFRNDIKIQFGLTRSGAYDYQDIKCSFSIQTGSLMIDVPVIFSMVRKTQELATYVLQKAYLVMKEVKDRAGLELFDWNVYPNQLWFLSVTGLSTILYKTKGDMLANTNPYAAGVADEDTLQVTLKTTAGDTMGYYYQDMQYHFTLSSGVCSLRQFSIKPFTDLEELRHPIYNNSNIVISRGEAELNLHTYAIMGREILLGDHIPSMEIGQIVEIESVRRNIVEKNQIISQSIEGAVNNGSAYMVNTIRVATYKELFRQ